MAVQKGETFEPVTMGHIRSHGCRDLLVYRAFGRCHHNATLNRGLAIRRSTVAAAHEWSARAVE
jgi:hypothetical protein